MKRIGKVTAASVLTLGLIFGGVGAASATTTHPDGGTFTYETGGPYIYSSYHHPSRVHGSSVKNCFGSLTRSALVGAGRTSSATREDGCLFAVDYAYYRFS